MAFDPLSIITAQTMVLPQENIDTDQIIPARFLTTTSKKGLGKLVFYDWRYDQRGEPLEQSAFNHVDPKSHQILVAGSNFGCGSSREHAPWALMDFGFRVIISSDIADIFKSNALKNGLLPVEVDTKTHQALLSEPGQEVTIDLERQIVSFGDGWTATFDVEPFARRCLIDGLDPLGALITKLPKIEAYEEDRQRAIA